MAGPDLQDLRNSSIILFIAAFLPTSYRCFARYTKNLWWYDDSVALFSALSFVLTPIGCALIANESSSHQGKVTGYYLVVVSFCTSIWSARVSIVLTVVRVTPWQLQRKILLWIAGFFILEFVYMTTQAFIVCELTHTGWKHIPGSGCILPRFVPISLVVTTVVSDAILVATPLMISWGVHIRALRFRLFSIFSMSVATTLASLVHAALVIASPGVVEGISGTVEVAVAIIVCNMSVIIPAVLRALGVGDPFMREDTVDPSHGSVEIARMTSTRVELVELGIPKTRGAAVTDSDESEGVTSAVVFRQRDSGDLGVKDEHKRLTTQASDASLGDSKMTKAVPFADEPDVTDLFVQVRDSPPVTGGRGLENKAVESDSA